MIRKGPRVRILLLPPANIQLIKYIMANTRAKYFIRWSINKVIPAFLKNFLFRTIRYALKTKKITFIEHTSEEASMVFDLVGKISEETQFMMDHVEALQLYLAVRSVGKTEGELAEVGTSRGASAKIICEAKRDRPLHLFDTFEGMPHISAIDYPFFGDGQFKANFEEVETFLKDYQNVYFYKGIFPATAEPVKEKKFSFVHLDVDIYESTVECLKFFYPRMSKGGIIISHDYNAPGVRKAFDNFFADKAEPIIALPVSQCLLVKV